MDIEKPIYVKMKLLAPITRSQKALILLYILLITLSYLSPVVGLLTLGFAIAKKKLLHLDNLSNGVLSIAAVLSINLLFYYLLNLLRLSIPIGIVGVLYTSIAIAVLAKSSKGKQKPILSAPYLSVLLVIAVGLLLLLTPVWHKSTASMMTFVAYGEDNASHYALFNYSYIHEDYSYRKNPENMGLLKTLEVYPQGFSFTTAWLARAVYSPLQVSDLRIKVRVFFVASVINFLSFITVLLLLVATIKPLMKPKRSFYISQEILLATIGLGLLLVGPLLMLFGRGFAPQIFAFTYFFGFLITLIAYAKDRQSLLSSTFIAVLMLAGVLSSWWLLLPVCGLTGLLFIVMFHGEYFKLLTKRRTLLALISFGGIVLLSAYPIIISLLFSTKTDPVNEPGGIDKLSLTVATLYGLVFFLIGCNPYKKQTGQTRLLFTTYVASIVFTASIAWYQFHTVGHVSYYYYKLLYLLIPFAFIGAAAFLRSLFELFLPQLKLSQIILMTLVIPLSGFYLFYTVHPGYPNKLLAGWTDNAAQVQDMQLIQKYSKSKDHKRDLVFLGVCNSDKDYSDYLANRWSGATFLSYDAWRQQIEVAVRDNDYVSIQALLNDPEAQQHQYVVRGSCVKLPNTVQQYRYQ